MGRDSDPHRPRVLVVDDEPAIVRLLVRLASRVGVEVDPAGELEVARALLEASAARGGYALVLSDLRMPGTTPREIVDALRAARDRSARPPRVVLMTGDAAEPEAADVIRDAGFPVLEKPFALAEVRQILESLGAG